MNGFIDSIITVKRNTYMYRKRLFYPEVFKNRSTALAECWEVFKQRHFHQKVLKIILNANNLEGDKNEMLEIFATKIKNNFKLSFGVSAASVEQRVVEVVAVVHRRPFVAVLLTAVPLPRFVPGIPQPEVAPGETVAAPTNITQNWPFIF